MDWHKLQHKLFEMDPSDPREDLQKLQQSLQGNAAQSDVSEPQIDYVTESYEVSEGSVPLDRDYSVDDFAALAGVSVTESKQKKGPEGQLKGTDSFKKQPAGTTKNPSRNKLVGDSVDNDRIKDLEERIDRLESLIVEMVSRKKSSATKKKTTTESSLKTRLRQLLDEKGKT